MACPRFGVPNLQPFGTSWSTVEAAFGTPIYAQRFYFSPSDNVPAASPTPPDSSTQQMIVSFKPTVASVLNGSLDSALIALFKTVRPGDMWTAWHEAEAHLTLANWQAVTAHIYPLFKTYAPSTAMYGEIHMSFTATTASSFYPLSQWILAGSSAVDFIGIDMYPSPDTQTWAQCIAPVVTQVTSVVTSPQWAICESNVGATTGLGLGTDAEMIAWNNAGWAWAQQNNSLTYVSYWGNAPLTWPPDASTTANLASINAEANACVEVTGITEDRSNAQPGAAWRNRFGAVTSASKESILYDRRLQISGQYSSAGDVAFGAVTRGFASIVVNDPLDAEPGPAFQTVFNTGSFANKKRTVFFDSAPTLEFTGVYTGDPYLSTYTSLYPGTIDFETITTGYASLGINDPGANPGPAWQNQFGHTGKNSLLFDVFPEISSIASGTIVFGALTTGVVSIPGSIPSFLAQPGQAWKNVFAHLGKQAVYYDGVVVPAIFGPFCFTAAEADTNLFAGTATDISVPYGGSSTDANLYGGTAIFGCDPVTANISLEEFNDEILDIALINNGAPMNLSGCGLRALFKTAPGTKDSSALIFSTTNGGIVISSVPAGTAVITIPNANLQNRNIRFWRLDLLTPIGTQVTVMAGTVAVQAL